MYVNGQQRAAGNGMTLTEFLQNEGYDIQRVAVEKNGRIVPKVSFGTEILSDDDRLEIVSFVGGG
jgi:thiamine biosynthesis protein ThiS